MSVRCSEDTDPGKIMLNKILQQVEVVGVVTRPLLEREREIKTNDFTQLWQRARASIKYSFFLQGGKRWQRAVPSVWRNILRKTIARACHEPWRASDRRTFGTRVVAGMLLEISVSIWLFEFQRRIHWRLPNYWCIHFFNLKMFNFMNLTLLNT